MDPPHPQLPGPQYTGPARGVDQLGEADAPVAAVLVQPQSVSGLPFGFDAVEVKQISKNGQLITRKQAGPANGEVTIVRGLDKSDAFTAWVNKTLAEQKPDEASPNLTIAQHDEQGQPAHRLTLTNAYATGSSSLGALESEPAIEKVTIVYEDIAIE
ncbi:phage tail protein [Streptomyces sp. NPDC088762]|uniref:phage tail protein n=1 Tax=Streptomyces sp. NPDC088762 TaxID=3365891 RepID=UPI0038264467